MNFEQNNNSKNESLESNEIKPLSFSKEVSDDESIISEQEFIDLKNKDEERTSFELFKIRGSILSNLDNDKELERDFDLTIKEGETDFDFLGRLSKFLADKQERQNIQKNPDENHKIIKLLKKKGNQVDEVYQDKDNENLIRLSFIKATESLGSEELLNNEKNEKCLNDIDISTSSRNMSWDLNENSGHEDKVGFFLKQIRRDLSFRLVTKEMVFIILVVFLMSTLNHLKL